MTTDVQESAPALVLAPPALPGALQVERPLRHGGDRPYAGTSRPLEDEGYRVKYFFEYESEVDIAHDYATRIPPGPLPRKATAKRASKMPVFRPDLLQRHHNRPHDLWFMVKFPDYGNAEGRCR
jgi:hypothetical protein